MAIVMVIVMVIVIVIVIVMVIVMAIVIIKYQFLASAAAKSQKPIANSQQPAHLQYVSPIL